MENFYVHLQSDASEHHYNANSRTNFKNHLAQPIDVDSNRFEVALTEMSYVHNRPFIKAGTKLYTTLTPKPEVSGSRVIEYPDVYNIEGANESTYTHTVSVEIYNYAKEKSMHLESALRYFTDNQLTNGSSKILLLHFTMDVLATKDISSIDGLLEDLNATLKPIKVSFEKSDKRVIIRHKTPHLIAKKEFDYVPKLKSYFSLTDDKDEDEFGYENKEYFHSCLLNEEAVTIKKKEKLLTISFFKGEISLAQPSFKAEQIESGTTLIGFAHGNLYNTQDLVDAINSIRPTMVNALIVDGRAQLKIKMPEDSKVIFNERVMAILGLDISNETIFPKDKEIVIDASGNHVFDIGMRKMYIYVDCIKNQRIGDQLAPLLRKTSFSGSHGADVIKEFSILHYVPISKDFIDSIRVYIRSETGEPLPLEFGTVSITLHFREKRF